LRWNGSFLLIVLIAIDARLYLTHLAWDAHLQTFNSWGLEETNCLIEEEEGLQKFNTDE